MANMVRKQVYLEARQDQALKVRAREWHVAEAEIIRQGLDRILRAPDRVSRDPGLWEREVQFMKRRRRACASGAKKRRWTRDQLHKRGREKRSRS